MATINLAIDLGGTNTSIYKKDEGLVLKEPTLIAVRKDEDIYDIIAFGNEAKKMQGKADENIIIFTPIVDGIIKSLEYTIEMLKYFLSKVIDKTFFKPYINAIMTVPSGISEEEKITYENVCYESKISKVTLIPSIISAMIGSEKSIHTSYTIMLCDMGGECTDIACINSNKIIKGITLGIGGRNMDREIANLVYDKFGISISISTAIKIKEEVGSLFENDSLSTEVTGSDITTELLRNIVITSEDIAPVIIYYLEQICLAIETNISLCSPEVIENIKVNGIYITGGLSKIHGVEKFIYSRVKYPVSTVLDPDNAVIIGAGKLLYDDIKIEDILKKF